MEVGGLITARRQVLTKHKDTMAILTLEDYTHTINIVVFPKTYGRYGSLTATDLAVRVTGRADINDENTQIVAERIAPLGEEKAEAPIASAHAAIHTGAMWQPGGGTKLFIKIPAHLERTDLSSTIAGVLKKYPGTVKVYFHLMGSRKTILTNEQYWITPDEDLHRELQALLEPGALVLK